MEEYLAPLISFLQQHFRNVSYEGLDTDGNYTFLMSSSSGVPRTLRIHETQLVYPEFLKNLIGPGTTLVKQLESGDVQYVRLDWQRRS